MKYKTKIYISEVTNLSDARYAAGMFVDYIGFPLDITLERNIDWNTFNAIRGWLQGINIVVEFNDLSINEINDLIVNQELNIISIPYSRIADCIQINVPIILRNAPSSIENLPKNVLFVTSKSNITNEGISFFIEDISISELDFAISNANGIVIKGSEEERPGYKDYDEMADIFDALEI